MVTQKNHRMKPGEPVFQKFGKRYQLVDANGMADTIAHQYRQASQQKGLPPLAFESVREIMRGFATAFNGILLYSDHAVSQNRKLQRMMRRIVIPATNSTHGMLTLTTVARARSLLRRLSQDIAAIRKLSTNKIWA